MAILTRFRNIIFVAAAVLFWQGIYAVAQPAHHSVLIRGGTVMDGSGKPGVVADVAIDGDRIVAVGVGGVLADHTADRVIDATGLVVAPGFIDVHTHADDDLYKLPLAENFIRDGVTTIVTGNCGYGVPDVKAYFDKLKRDGVAINVATLVGHNSVLRAVKGDKKGDLTAEQLAKGQEIVRQAMRDGAIGFSTGLIYTPGIWSETAEIIALCKPAAEAGGIYATHMRSEGASILAAIDEALLIGKEAGCPVQISHLKLPTDAAAKIGAADSPTGPLARIRAARAAGQDVGVDQYPYTASSTSLSTMLSDFVLEGGAESAKKQLQDPAVVAKVLEEMQQRYASRGRKDLSFAVITSCAAHPEYSGRSVMQVAQMMKLKASGGRGELLTDAGKDAPVPLPEVTMEEQCRAVIQIFVDGGAGAVFHTMDETQVQAIMRDPLVAICSDSGVREFGVGAPHPRGYGSNARVLGRYVRELKTIPLEEAVRRMTSLPASYFRIADRGTIRPGAFADVVVFDAGTVTDNATFENPHQYSSGFRAVLVNGQMVVDGDKTVGAKPGRPVIGPGYVATK